MFEPPECYDVKERRAKKDHKCCECKGTIKKGETYHYHHGVWNGEGASFKKSEEVQCRNLRMVNSGERKSGRYVGLR